MGYANAAEDAIKEQLLKQVKEFIDKQLAGKVPQGLLDAGLKELEDELDKLTLYK